MKVHGLLLLDKPKGLSSNAALQKARRLLDADKAGHGGTLDPMADGLLPVMFGEACKLAESALEGDKAYEATVRLGQVTDTDDTEGEVVATAPVAFSDAQLDAVLARFRGRIVQVPPVYSALKVAGKPLYRYARDGNPVQAVSRQVTIHELQLLARQAGRGAVAVDPGCLQQGHLHPRAGARHRRRARLRRSSLGACAGPGWAVSTWARRSISTRSLQCRWRSATGSWSGWKQLVSDWPSVMLDQASAMQFCQGQAVRLPPGSLAVAGEPAVVAGGDDSVLKSGEACEPSPRIAVHCGGRLIGLGRSTLTTESIGALAPVRIIVS